MVSPNSTIIRTYVRTDIFTGFIRSSLRRIDDLNMRRKNIFSLQR